MGDRGGHQEVERPAGTLLERVVLLALLVLLLLGLPMGTYQLGKPTNQVVLTPGETLDLAGAVEGATLLPEEERGSVLLLTVDQQVLNRLQLFVARWRGEETQDLQTGTLSLASGAGDDAEMATSKADAWTVATTYTGHGGESVPQTRTEVGAEGTSYALGDGDVPEVATDEIAGPSGGLALALAFTDALTPGVLTGGRVVAVTGTIESTGNVGEVGGVALKVEAAERDGAEVVLVPLGNAQEAAQSAGPGTEVVAVGTFEEAVRWLCYQGANDAVCAPGR